MATAGLGAARGVAADHECLAALCEVARVRIGLGDLPAARETDAVGMEQPPEAATVWAPAQVGMRVYRARHRLAEPIVAAEWQQAFENASERDLIGGNATIAVPDTRIGITEYRIAHVGKARARVRPIGVDNLFDSIRWWCHHGATPV